MKRLVPLFIVLFCSCATFQIERLRQEHAKLLLYDQEIDSRLAPYCAPGEYAAFVTNLAFLEEEMGEKDARDAQVYSIQATGYARASKNLTSICSDADRDGLPNESDACPYAKEDPDSVMDADGCPDPDDDGDGIPDVKDKCPDVRETINTIEDEDGCPEGMVAEAPKKAPGILPAVRRPKKISPPAKQAPPKPGPTLPPWLKK